ncbi:MAG: hypothetical protein QNL04_00655 [SAR324 cluster bacterium]|nr:hypothetical protein [SAR324 cluster bacterium]
MDYTKISTFLIALLFPMLTTNPLLGVECKELRTANHYKKLFQKTKTANPLNLDRFSLFFEISPCEGDGCKSENRLLRIKNQEAIHIIKMGENQRIHFISGSNAPQCFIRNQSKDYKCISCSESRNENCRSYKIEGSDTLIKGTNIDSSDFDFLENDQYKSSCSPVANNKDYLLIESSNPQANLWQKVEIYFEKKRELPILIRFFHKGALAKVYRFYPQSYILVKGHWYSAQFRVRSVNVSETRYFFETSFKLLINKKNQHHLYLEPEEDPMLNVKELNGAFQIN